MEPDHIEKDGKPGFEVFAGRYEIVSRIGEGGSGEIHRVRDRNLDKHFALKRLRFLKSENRKILRFQREAKAASKLKHSGLIEVFDFGIADNGTPYLVMELIEGVSLDSLIETEGMELDRALRIAELVCDAMQHAHLQKVIHRDLKPSNILIVETEEGDERIKIVDFGLAAIVEEDGRVETMTPTHGIAGSPMYMSPEQASRQNIDARTDVYSLGCVLFELISGRPPFLGETALELVEQHAHEPPPHLNELVPEASLPPRLCATVRAMLAKDPEERPASMAAVRDSMEICRLELAREQEQKSVLAGATTSDRASLHRVVKPGALLLFVMAALGSWFLMTEKPVPPRTEAEESQTTSEEELDQKNSKLMFDAADRIAGGGTGDGQFTMATARNWNGDNIDDLTIEQGVSPDLNLTGCYISQANITNKSAARMAECKSLKSISMDFCSKIDDRALDSLKRLPSLTILSLRGSEGITDQGMSALTECPKLRKLDLGNNKNITANGIKKLSKLPDLAHIAIGDTKIKGKDFLVVASLPHVTVLGLDFSTVSDEDMRYIKELGFLRSVTLSGTTISDRALLMLAHLPGLQNIQLHASKGYSEKSVVLLKSKFGNRCLIELKRPYQNLEFQPR